MGDLLDNDVARNTCIEEFRIRHPAYSKSLVSDKVLGNILREICPSGQKIEHAKHRAVDGSRDLEKYLKHPGATAKELRMKRNRLAAVKKFVAKQEETKARLAAGDLGVPKKGPEVGLGAAARHKASPRATYQKVGKDDWITLEMRKNTHLSPKEFCERFNVTKHQYSGRMWPRSTATGTARTTTHGTGLVPSSMSTPMAGNVSADRPGSLNKFPVSPAFPSIMNHVLQPVAPMANTTAASLPPGFNQPLPYSPPASHPALSLRTESGPMPMPNPPGYRSPRP